MKIDNRGKAGTSKIERPIPLRAGNIGCAKVCHHIDGDDQVVDDRVISGFNGITDRNLGMPLIASEMPLFLKTMELAGGYDALTL